jgi:glycopeptide antibiotics resistance protein
LSFRAEILIRDVELGSAYRGAMRPLAWLVLAIALIVIAVFPWGDFQGHTHWSKVGWIPFVSKPLRLPDVVANIVLFAPFGAAFGRLKRGPRALLLATVCGAALSLLGETAQLYSHTRFPSATDLVCNAAGAALGAVLVTHRLRTGAGGERVVRHEPVPPTKVAL